MRRPPNKTGAVSISQLFHEHHFGAPPNKGIKHSAHKPGQQAPVLDSQGAAELWFGSMADVAMRGRTKLLGVPHNPPKWIKKYSIFLSWVYCSSFHYIVTSNIIVWAQDLTPPASPPDAGSITFCIQKLAYRKISHTDSHSISRFCMNDARSITLWWCWRWCILAYKKSHSKKYHIPIPMKRPDFVWMMLAASFFAYKNLPSEKYQIPIPMCLFDFVWMMLAASYYHDAGDIIFCVQIISFLKVSDTDSHVFFWFCMNDAHSIILWWCWRWFFCIQKLISN
jgi:hypothetical protein